MEYQFNPDITLDHNERASIAQTVATSGYKVIHRIMRSEVDKFIINLINAPEEDTDSIIARHKLAKAAAQFFSSVTGRVNHEVQQYVADVRDHGMPIDPTEGLIDLGAPPSTQEDLASDDLLMADQGEEVFSE